jgi:hypothetical protein
VWTTVPGPRGGPAPPCRRRQRGKPSPQRATNRLFAASGGTGVAQVFELVVDWVEAFATVNRGLCRRNP